MPMGMSNSRKNSNQYFFGLGNTVEFICSVRNIVLDKLKIFLYRLVIRKIVEDFLIIRFEEFESAFWAHSRNTESKESFGIFNFESIIHF